MRALFVGILSLTIISSCSLISVKPQVRNLQTRIQDFPNSDIPLTGKAELLWNEYQVPFIKADNDQDAALLLGMVHAHLRLGQIYLFREVVNHRLASHLGPLATRIDHSLMAMGVFDAVDSIAIRLEPNERQWIQAFVDGLNLYQTRMKTMPLELKALNISPSPWDISDILKMGRLISADVNWFNWLGALKLEDEDKWKQYWNEIGSQPGGTILSSGNYTGKELLASLMNGMAKTGSNALVIGPSRSETGSALMASDPHLGMNLPNMWLLAGYQCPSYHVVGMMFPGLPAVLVGRNPHISFSGTNMRSASSDLIELSPDQIAKLRVVEKRIVVRGWLDKKIKLRYSDWGPVVSDAPLFRDKGRVIALRWVGHQPSNEIGAALKMNQATNWQEFRASFADYAVSGQNFLYADTDNHIGLVPAVKIPVRAYERPASITVKSSHPEQMWQGCLSPLDLPYLLDPEDAYIASANNQPLKAATPLGFAFSSDDRVQRMDEVIKATDKIGLKELMDLHPDTVIPSARLAAGWFVSKLSDFATSDKDDPATGVIAALKDWDGDYRIESKAPVVYELLLYYSAKEYYTAKYGKKLANRILGMDTLSELLISDLSSDPNGAKDALYNALKKGWKRQARFASWGAMHRYNASHYFGMIPLIGKRYRFGNYPVDGSSNSLMKTAHTRGDKKHNASYGACSRFVTDIGDMDANYFVLLGGQDGWLGSPGLTNQIPLWQKGDYMRLPLRWEAIQARFPYRVQFND